MNQPLSQALSPVGSDAQRFEILELLGRGGMGDVYKAWDAELEQHVALKSLRSSAAGDPIVLERFKRELKLARRIKHVNVAQVHDLVVQDGVRYLSMEYVDGKALSDILAVKGRLPLRLALGIMRQVCSGVHAAHEVGVIHRDLKPHNIMIRRESGRVLILDFGIAREACGTDLTEAGLILGSPQYMSYEQLSGEPVTTRSDIYALGILLFEMVTGVTPFRVPGASAATLRALREVPPDPRRHEPDLPDFVCETIRTCLAKDPGQRFPTALQLVRSLEAARDEAGPPPEPSTTLQVAADEIEIAAAPRALVALPETTERDEVVDRLERLGCEVELAPDGMASVEACFEREYALVVLGAALPRMDGFTACQLIRRNPRTDRTRIMVVLDGSDGGREAFAREVGATAVLRRPVNVHALSRQVRELLPG